MERPDVMAEQSLPDARVTPLLSSGARRNLQIALGLIWLMDGALQLQPFMFRRSFVTQIIAPNEADQPAFIAASIRLAAHLIEPRVVLFNVFVVTIQVLIGAGLLYRPTVRAALLTSFAWGLGIWWIGEGLGGLFTGNGSPLTGSPGAALLYVFAGLLAWPSGGSKTDRRDAGTLREHGARLAWAVLWLMAAALWMLPANRTAGAVTDEIANAPSGAGWLSTIHSTVATAAAGHGGAIAVGAASLSAAVASAALVRRCAKPALVVAVVLALAYSIIGQGIGGVLTGSATDPNTGPLLILLAISIYPIHRGRRLQAEGDRAGRAPARDIRGREDGKQAAGRSAQPRHTRGLSLPQ